MDDCIIIWGSNRTRQRTGRQLTAGESYNERLVTGIHTPVHAQIHAYVQALEVENLVIQL